MSTLGRRYGERERAQKAVDGWVLEVCILGGLSFGLLGVTGGFGVEVVHFLFASRFCT